MSDATNPGQPGLPHHYQTPAKPGATGQTFESDTDGGGLGGLGIALPTLLALGGGIAALWLVERETKALSRGANYVGDHAYELYDDAGDWLGDAAHSARETAGEWGESAKDFGHDSLLAAGAKAAGVVGLLKALGGGELSTGATRAAKALAMKKLAGYAASAGGKAAKVAAKHPEYAAAAKKKAAQARAAAQDAADRARRAYRSASGRPVVEESSFGTGGAVLALTVLGLGAGAAYLFAQNHPDQIAKARKKATTYGDRAADIARDAAARAKDLAGEAYDYVGEHGGDYAHSVAARVGLGEAVPMNDEQLVSSVRRAIGAAVPGDTSDLRIIVHDGSVTLGGKLPGDSNEAALSAVRGVAGVKDVKIESDAGANA